MILAEEEFSRKYQREYGYGNQIEKIRKEEFSRLKDTVYLDSTGAALYPQSLLDKFYKDLSSHVYGNPHSRNISSQQSTDVIEQVRNRILELFNTTPDHHSIIFTAGATSALKLVAESFLWKASSVGGSCNNTCDDRSCFCFLEDNHTSVVGMREIAVSRGAHICCVKSEEIAVAQKDPCKMKHPRSHKEATLSNCDSDTPTSNLFAFPAMCNFSGRKYPLEWISSVKNGTFIPCRQHCCKAKWLVLLDAASFVSTSRLDLNSNTADFVPLSFYKMFGFPTGLGALVVKNTSACLLKKCYYGGGTVLATVTTDKFHLPKPDISERFEDGTISFLDIVALRHGLDTFQALTGSIESISSHTFSLAQFVYQTMKDMKHYNGQTVCILYCDTVFDDVVTQGPVISFNIRRSNGEYVGYSEVEKMASLYNIHLRTGCFCNTGACQRHLGLSNEQVLTNLAAGHVCGDNMDLINGSPTGAVRISFGFMSNFSDAETFLKVIVECFVEKSKNIYSIKEMNLTISERGKGCMRYDIPVVSCCAPDGGHFTKSSEPSFNNPVASLQSENVNICVNEKNVEGQVKNVGKSLYSPLLGFPICGKDDDNGLRSSETTSCTQGASLELRGIDSLSKEAVTGATNLNKSTTNICYSATSSVTVQRIYLYPIKSCAAFEVSDWAISSTGFIYDRQWMVVNESGACLSQKREPRLCLVKPAVHLPTRSLFVAATGMKTLKIPLAPSEGLQEKCEATMCPTKVCGDRVVGLDCGQEAAIWFSEFLGKPCRLLQQNPSDFRKCKISNGTKDFCGQVSLSLANESQFLLVSRASTRDLLRNIQTSNGSALNELSEDDIIDRFRPNIVISGTKPYEEESWEKINIGSQNFKCLGQCSRCQMVCVDQKTGERNTEPLKTLARTRGAKIPFGVYVLHSPNMETTARIQVGDLVLPE